MDENPTDHNEIDFSTQLIKACDLLLEGQHQPAKKLLRTINAKNKKQTERLTQLTKLAQSKSTQLKAKLLTCKAEELLYRGHEFLLQGQYQQTIDDYSAALDISPGLNNKHKAEAHLKKGHALDQLQQHQQALEDHSAALAIAAGLNIEYRTLAYLSRGLVFLQLGQYQQAINDCSAALDIQGVNNEYKAQAYLNRGHAQTQLHQYQLAVDDYKLALAIPHGLNNEFTAIAFLGRGHAFFQQEQYQQALKDYIKVLWIEELNNKFKTQAYLGRWQAFLMQGQYQLAVGEYKLALNNTNEPDVIMTVCEYIALKTSKRSNITKEAKEAFQKFALGCSNEISARYIKDIEIGKGFLNRLASEINQLLHEQCYFPSDSNQTLAHYTNLHCCQQLIKRDPFRMYHIRYMDDVLEGQHIWQHLNLSKPDSANPSHTFIGSFVQRRNDQSALSGPDVANWNDQSVPQGCSFQESMDMWRIYGQHKDQPANGCCLLFKPSDMPENLRLITAPLIASMQQTNSHTTNPQLRAAGLPYRFFKVLYRDSDELKHPDSPIKGIVDCLKNLEDPEYDFKQDPQVLKEVYRMLDQIRFLIKSKAYEHEHEVRLIQFHVPETNILLDGDRLPPRFYIEVPAEFAPDTIILGPRAERLEEWQALEQKHADGSQPISIIESQLEVRSR